MEELKVFEIRDSGTFLPAVAIGIFVTGNSIPDYLLGRSGFGKNSKYTLLTKLSDNKTEWDHINWGDRTMSVAHKYIIEHWHELKTGEVIDVEFILGETSEKKVSEFYGEVYLP